MDHREVPVILQKMEVIDLPAILDLANKSFPSDEVEDAKVMDYRLNYASHLCYVCFHVDTNEFVGFIMATGAPDDTSRLTKEMRHNHYHGNVLCIHTVVIAEQHRRNGFGTFLVRNYLEKIRATTSMKNALLVCKRGLIPFYRSLGFQETGLIPDLPGKAKTTFVEMSRSI